MIISKKNNGKVNIVLIGMPGVGKTTIGRLLAEQNAMSFVDTDDYIERKSGMRIPDIFKQYGEQYFRQLETEALRDLFISDKAAGNAVIALGGGTVEREENYEIVKEQHESNAVVFLERSLEALARESAAYRPVSQKRSVAELYERRLPYYEKWADIRLDMEDRTPEKAVETLSAETEQYFAHIESIKNISKIISKKSRDESPFRVAFHTLGCKVNQYETERMKEQYIEAGCEIVDEEDEADLYIINTCTVTNIADRKSRQYIRRMKKQSPQAVIAVTGCYSQVAPEELAAMPEVDIVTGNGDKNNLINLVRRFMTEDERIIDVKPYDSLIEYTDKGIITSMKNRTRAYIKIQEGCDRFCAYCLIPFARGHVRSRDPEEIILEAKTLVDQGFKEIVLTGINTALYGTESGFIAEYPQCTKTGSGEGAGMEYLISRINDIAGEFRLRLSSLEPTVVNRDYVARLMKYEKLCHHLHLSIQSGSDKIIGLMNRQYTRQDYLEIVKVLREADKHYGITTDIIVGFPGEEKEDFEDSLDMVDRVRFLKVHTFKYSKRRGTAAESMKNQVPGGVKNLRSDRLLEKSEEVQRSFLDAQKGSVRTVLFEELLGGDTDSIARENMLETNTKGCIEKVMLTGYTDNYVKVYVPVDSITIVNESDKDRFEGYSALDNDIAGGTGVFEPANYINSLKKVKLLEIYRDGMKGEIENG